MATLELTLSGLLLFAGPTAAAPPATAGADAVPLERAAAAARGALQLGETELAESGLRSVLQDGWMQLGALASAAGDDDAARSAYREALGAAVPTRLPRLSLAVTLLRLGEPSEAVLVLRTALIDDPTDLEARQLLARALLAAGERELALQELEELKVLSPADPEILYQLATVHLRNDDPDAAAAELDALTQRRPGPATWILVGRTWRDFEHFDRARAALGRALELDPGARRAHYYLGTTELLDGGHRNLDVAADHLRRELERAPGDPMTSFYLGMILAEQRRDREATPHLEVAAGAAGMPPEVFQFLGRSLLAEERPGEAAEAFRRGLAVAQAQMDEQPEGASDQARENRVSRLHYQLALALRRSGDEAGAAEHFEAAKRYSVRSTDSSRDALDRFLRGEAAAATPTDLELPVGSPALVALAPEERDALARRIRSILASCALDLGVLAARSQRFGRAAESFRRAVELDPDSQRARYSLGVALFNDGRWAEATGPLAAAFAAGPADPELRRMLAVASLRSGDPARAAELLGGDPARETDPHLGYTYALALVRSGRAAEAEGIFAGLLTENADWAELHVVLGQARAQQGDFDGAVRSLERALELGPEVTEAWSTLGEIHLRNGRLPEAEAALRAELERRPGDPGVLYDLAVVLDLDGRPAPALEVLERLLAAHPARADGRYLMGKILLAEGSPEEAREQLEAAVGLSPEDAHSHYQLALTYRRLGRDDDAAREFETFRRLKDADRRPEGSG